MHAKDIELVRWYVSGPITEKQWCADQHLTKWGKWLVGKEVWDIVIENNGEIVAKFFSGEEAEKVRKALQSGLTFFGPRDIPEPYKVVDCEPMRTDKEGGAEICADRRPSYNLVLGEEVICNCPEDKKHYASWIAHLYNNWAAHVDKRRD